MKQHRLSCVCLHSDRSPDERQHNLERFKANEVRFLICTDVAARGIDVSGLPFGKPQRTLCSSASMYPLSDQHDPPG